MFFRNFQRTENMNYKIAVPGGKLPTLETGAERLYASGWLGSVDAMSVEPMTARIRRALELAYPGQDDRYFSPMAIGNTPETADEGAFSQDTPLIFEWMPWRDGSDHSR